MLKLLKYEFRKTWTAKLVLLALGVFLELLLLINFFVGNASGTFNNLLSLSSLGLASLLVVDIVSLVTLHHDINRWQGHMLFMTSHSSHTILGAKVIENCLSNLLICVIFALATLGNLHLIQSKFEVIEIAEESVTEITELYGTNFWETCASVLGLIASALMWFFADIIATIALPDRRGNICLAVFFRDILVVIRAGISYLLDFLNIPPDLVSITISIVFAVVMYFFSVRMIDRRLRI